MVYQKYLMFDYDDTVMPSNITRKLSGLPDYGAQQVKDKLDPFYQFIVYWKKTTNVPIIILSAGTIAYMHLISLYGRFLRISVNYFDPAMDVCMFVPIPFTALMSKRLAIRLDANNGVNTTLQQNAGKYYQHLLKQIPHIEYYSINPNQIEKAADKAYKVVPDKSREFVNGLSHRKISYLKKTIDSDVNGCFYLPGINYQRELGMYEFMNCRRQFKNLDALRRHIAMVTNKQARLIHFYFFDDKASHLGMGDDDIYLSKPFKYPSTHFVGKIVPILVSLMDGEKSSEPTSREGYRKNELKLLNRLVAKLSKTNNLVFVAKEAGASPLTNRRARVHK